MNRLSTAGFVPPSVYIGFCLFVLLERCSGDVSAMLWKYEGGLSPGRGVSLASSPARPRPAIRRAPRPDPPVVCPGFGRDKFARVGALTAHPGTWVHKKTKALHAAYVDDLLMTARPSYE